MLKKGVLPHHVSILLPFSWDINVGYQRVHAKSILMSSDPEVKSP